MFFSPMLMLAGAAAQVASEPQLVDAGFDLVTSTWTTPASVSIGHLILAGRITTSGSVDSMGDDFTSIGHSGAITTGFDINYRYRIATQAGATVHTLGGTPGGGVVWSVWRTGTFNASSPVSGWNVDTADHQSIVWPSTVVAAPNIVIGGGWNSLGMLPGLVPGATLLSENATASPARYLREWYKAGGWTGQTVNHNPAGSLGQDMCRWFFTVNGMPGAETIDISGGTITNPSGYKVATITSNDNLVVTGSGTLNYELVGGGGGGGYNRAGGGGGGERVTGSMSVTAGTYAVVIGQGGAAQTVFGSNGNPGTDTTVTSLSLVADGGGYGGAILSGTTGSNGGPGGNGGGGSGGAVGAAGVGGTGDQNDGGAGVGSGTSTQRSGGGGGGAGANGGNGTTTNGGNGGVGVASACPGVSAVYGNGGGGFGATGGTGSNGAGSGGTESTAGGNATGVGNGGGGGHATTRGGSGSNGIAHFWITA